MVVYIQCVGWWLGFRTRKTGGGVECLLGSRVVVLCIRTYTLLIFPFHVLHPSPLSLSLFTSPLNLSHILLPFSTPGFHSPFSNPLSLTFPP